MLVQLLALIHVVILIHSCRVGFGKFDSAQQMDMPENQMRLSDVKASKQLVVLF